MPSTPKRHVEIQSSHDYSVMKEGEEREREKERERGTWMCHKIQRARGERGRQGGVTPEATRDRDREIIEGTA